MTSLSANIKAIETAVAIHSQGRTATQEEKQVLAQYSGFGGIKDVLDLGTDKPLDKEVAGLLNRLLDALRTLAGGDEAACRSLVESIKSSVLTAFYTPQFLIDAVAAQIHKTFSANGLQMQSFLEPSVGIGGFLPVAMPGTRSYAFEKDTITGLVLSLLHEDATTVTAGFETIGTQELEHRKSMSLPQTFLSATSVSSMPTCGKRAVSTNRPQRPFTTIFCQGYGTAFRGRSACLCHFKRWWPTRQEISLYVSIW